MNLHVEVTAEDIAAGEKGHCQRCPIALAMLRCPNVFSVVVGEEISVQTYDQDQWTEPYVAECPSVASKFVGDFDSGDKVEPFSFDIELERDVEDDDESSGAEASS